MKYSEETTSVLTGIANALIYFATISPTLTERERALANSFGVLLGSEAGWQRHAMNDDHATREGCFSWTLVVEQIRDGKHG